jgi:hypothetical protein
MSKYGTERQLPETFDTPPHNTRLVPATATAYSSLA